MFLSLKVAEREARVLVEKDGGIWCVCEYPSGWDVVKFSNVRRTDKVVKTFKAPFKDASFPHPCVYGL